MGNSKDFTDEYLAFTSKLKNLQLMKYIQEFEDIDKLHSVHDGNGKNVDIKISKALMKAFVQKCRSDRIPFDIKLLELIRNYSKS